jgi:enoyl-[acyl-carrier protein] reductase II
MKTRITELFGIKHPIMLAGMNWITEPGIVSAVSNTGGLGVFAMAHCSPDEVRTNIRKIRELTDKPFGVNQILNAPLAKENLQVAIEENVPVINYALGKPWFIEQVHAYGGKVIGTIAKSKHAQQAEKLGVDAISITGYEAAAHGMAATSLVLIPIVTNWVKVPLIAAGGFFDGRGLAAALMLGADAVSMGTRFVLTQECIAHDNLKKLCLSSNEEDTLYSDVFDGLPSRVLKNKATEAMFKRGGLPIFTAIAGAFQIKRAMNLSMGDFIRSSFGMMAGEDKRSIIEQARTANALFHFEKAIYQGDVENGWMMAGQDIGAIRDLPTCQEVIDRTVAEAEKLLAQAGTKYTITT